MTIQTTYVNHLNLTYSGNGKYVVTWAGWPSDNFKTVRRVIHSDYVSAGDIAPKAAQLFADWLETGPMGDKCRCVIDLVTCGHIKGDKSAIGVATTWKESV
jgi:hypothetical protein